MRVRQSKKKMLRKTVFVLHNVFAHIPTITREHLNTSVHLRGRVNAVRTLGKVSFINVRQPPASTIQVVAGEALSSEVAQLTPESIIDIEGKIVESEKEIASASIRHMELQAEKITCLSKAASPLPFPLEDKSAKLETRLNDRSFELRTKLNAAIFRVQSEICQYFRQYMSARYFTEIHTPKLIPSPSEGGSAVFSVNYFGREAYLAQSPQLYKQMAILGDFERVFEIGPVFRAENSQTHRHLTEFVGLDAEMSIENEGTHEVLEVLEGVLINSIVRLSAEGAGVVRALNHYMETPSEAVIPMVRDETVKELGVGNTEDGVASTDKYNAVVGSNHMLRLTFKDAVQILQDAKAISEPITDFTPALEKTLGEQVKQRYGVDMFVCEKFPTVSRPFYTKVDPENPQQTLSFDVFLRGQEICSGSQREHDVEKLKARAAECGVSADLIKDYLRAFEFGAWPHGGFGIGLERFVACYAGLQDVRLTSMFPRDPHRLSP